MGWNQDSNLAMEPLKFLIWSSKFDRISVSVDSVFGLQRVMKAARMAALPAAVRVALLAAVRVARAVGVAAAQLATALTVVASAVTALEMVALLPGVALGG